MDDVAKVLDSGRSERVQMTQMAWTKLKEITGYVGQINDVK